MKITPLKFTKRRKALFRSQQKAADAMGVSQTTLSMWETGHNPIPLWAVKFLECLERAAPLNEMAEGFIKNMRLAEKVEKAVKGVTK